MSTDDTFRRQMFANIGTQGSGAGANAEAVTEAAIRTWDEIARQLAPIIGEGGFRALSARALHLTRSTYPWLAAQEAEQTSSPFTNLGVSLQRCGYSEARDASNALLVTFTELLATFIGQGLTTRLLRSVRADSSSKPAQDTKK
jgi:hypothetical protein